MKNLGLNKFTYCRVVRNFFSCFKSASLIFSTSSKSKHWGYEDALTYPTKRKSMFGYNCLTLNDVFSAIGNGQSFVLTITSSPLSIIDSVSICDVP